MGTIQDTCHVTWTTCLSAYQQWLSVCQPSLRSFRELPKLFNGCHSALGLIDFHLCPNYIMGHQRFAPYHVGNHWDKVSKSPINHTLFITREKSERELFYFQKEIMKKLKADNPKAIEDPVRKAFDRMKVWTTCTHVWQVYWFERKLKNIWKEGTCNCLRGKL